MSYPVPWIKHPLWPMFMQQVTFTETRLSSMHLYPNQHKFWLFEPHYDSSIDFCYDTGIRACLPIFSKDHFEQTYKWVKSWPTTATSLNCSPVSDSEAVNSMRDTMFAFKGDNGNGIDWDSWVGVVGFKLELAGNKLCQAVSTQQRDHFSWKVKSIHRFESWLECSTVVQKIGLKWVNELNILKQTDWLSTVCEGDYWGPLSWKQVRCRPDSVLCSGLRKKKEKETTTSPKLILPQNVELTFNIST